MKKLLLVLSFLIPGLIQAQCHADFDYFVQADTLVAYAIQNDTSSASRQYEWRLNYHQIISSAQSISPHGLQPGFHELTLKVVYADTATCFMTKLIKIGDAPCQLEPFAYQVQGLSVDFDFNNSLEHDTLFYTYTWNFGDGAFSQGWYPTHEYPTSGTYEATLYKTGPDTCSVSLSIEVGEPCSVDFNFSISGNTVSFDGTSNLIGDGSTLYWDFGDSTQTSTGASNTHTYNAAGQYLVTLSVENPRGRCQIKKWVVIEDKDTSTLYPVSIILSVNSGILHKNIVSFYSTDQATIEFVKSIVLDSGYVHRYQLPQGSYLIQATPHPDSDYFHIYEPTYYGNSTDWSSATILQLTESKSISIDMIAMTDQNRPDDSWYTGEDRIEGHIYETNPNARALGKTGFESVMVTLYNSLGQKLSVTFTDSEGRYVFTNLPAGDYTLKITYPGNMESMTLQVTLDGDSSTIEETEALDWSKEYLVTNTFSKNESTHILIAPNPVTDHLIINGPTGKFEFEIINTFGQVIDKGAGDSKTIINTTNLLPGAYLVRIHDKNGVTIKQIIKN